MRLAAAALVLLAAAGCAEPPADGALACGSNAAHSCPASFSCVAGRCYRAGHAPEDMTAAVADEDMAAPGDMVAADLTAPADLAPVLALDDDFQPPSLDGHRWTINGAATVIDDTGAGAATAAQVTAGAGGLNYFESAVLALPGDFTLRARLRATGVTSSSSIAFGLREGHELAFLVPLSQPANWQLLTEGGVTTPSGTFPVGASYADFEIRRVGAAVTMSIGGVQAYAFSPTTLDGNRIKASVSGAGAILVDRVTLSQP